MVPIELESGSDKVSFGIMKLQEAILGHIELESAWLQTVINQSQRRDRCVMRIESNKDTIQIELPAGWRRNEIKVYLNGKPALVQPTDSEQSIWVKLSEGTGISKRNSVVSMGLKRSDLLEFFSWTESQSSWYKKVEPDLPSIEGVTSPFPFDWQVVTSADECLWSRSYSLLPERRWNWSNLAWSSSLINAQKYFEDKFQANPQPPLPEYSNNYLFKSIWDVSGSHDRWSKKIALVPRFVLWFPVAICVLLLTSLWPRIGVLQHPWFMLVVAVALGILSMWAPDMVVVLLQSALTSLLVVFVVKSMQWALKQRGYRRSVFAGRAAPVTTRSISSDDSNRGKSKSNVSMDVLISPTTNTMQSVSPRAPSETI